MVAAVSGPGGEAAQVLAHDAGHTLADPQGGHGAKVLVGVDRQRLLPLTGQGRHEVVGQDGGLAHGVLGGGGAGGLRILTGEVGNRGAVAGRPGPGDDDAVTRHLERGQRGHAAARLDGQVGLAKDGGGLDAGGPHDGVGVELGAVRQDDVPVDAGVEEGVEAHVDTAFAQLLQAVAGELLGQLGQDAARSLHEDEAHVLLLHGVDGGHQCPGHVLELGDGLDPGEAAADEDEGEQPASTLGVPGGGGVLDA